jgi:Acyl-coenzyme A synthetases/AMP-(fatty) acid ligases
MKDPETFNWVEEIFDGLHKEEGRDALIWTDVESGNEERYSFSEFSGKGNKLLNYLKNREVRKGEGVYVMLPLIPEIWFSFYAIFKGGFVGVPCATNLTEEDLAYRFSNFPPSAIITSQGSISKIEEALSKTKTKPKAMLVVGKAKGNWEEYEVVEGESRYSTGERTNFNDAVLNYFTSGTTGNPKQVIHTSSYPIGHLSTTSIIGLKRGDIHNNLSTPGWAKYAWSSFFAPLNVGATVLAINFTSFNPEKYLALLESFKANAFCAPPTIWRQLVLLDISKFNLENLRETVSAGEPLNPEVIRAWSKKTGLLIRDFYGQTETTAIIGNPPWKKNEVIPGSFGWPSKLYDIVLLDENEKEIELPHQIGSIAIRLNRWRPKGLFKEYLNNPRKNAEVFKAGYYLTGDKAYFDEKGYWWFVAREDDVVKVKDKIIGSFEVESAIMENNSVAEVAVVGVNFDGEKVLKAFVVLKPSFKPSRELAQDIVNTCKVHLPEHKVPRVIEFVNSLPKTVSGKIRRVELRAGEGERKRSNLRENEFFL